MHGPGPVPPDPRWPDGARIAVQFVLNYEEGGENCLLHGDTESEAFLSEIVGARPWPGQRHWNMESLYEYGARAGFWRLHRIFTAAEIPVTVFAVASALARSPAQMHAMQESGWEIASHGLKWIEHKDMSVEEERAAIAEAVRLHSEVTGTPPRGWYTGRCSMNTLALVSAHGGFDYIADSYADDLPYWVEAGARDQLVIPYTLDANDMRFATAQGFNTGEDFFCYLAESFDQLYEEGKAGAARMLSIGLHCRIAGRPGRARAVRRFVDYAKSKGAVWFARRIDIAAHWHRHFPHKRYDRPSQMSRAPFIDAFGSVFEHSPWIAGRAFDLELGPAHDTAQGMHNALCRVFRSASDEERLGVLKAHPDLAGKLSQEKQLTELSAREQGKAGLDHLTQQERRLFLDLNTRYREKHGFPFIIAARDHTCAAILDAFHARLENDNAHEFATACRAVERIAQIRLKDMLP